MWEKHKYMFYDDDNWITEYFQQITTVYPDIQSIKNIRCVNLYRTACGSFFGAIWVDIFLLTLHTLGFYWPACGSIHCAMTSRSFSSATLESSPFSGSWMKKPSLGLGLEHRHRNRDTLWITNTGSHEIHKVKDYRPHGGLEIWLCELTTRFS